MPTNYDACVILPYTAEAQLPQFIIARNSIEYTQKSGPFLDTAEDITGFRQTLSGIF
jgi:hypothetical protein